MDATTRLDHLVERPAPEPGYTVEVKLSERPPICRDDRCSRHHRLDMYAAERLCKRGHAHNRLGIRHERLAFLDINVSDDFDVLRRWIHANLLQTILGILSRDEETNTEAISHSDGVVNPLGRADSTDEQKVFASILGRNDGVHEITHVKVVWDDRLL